MYYTDDAPPLLDLNTLLRNVGIDPGGVVVLAHTPREPELRKVLPWIIQERRDLFEGYQAIQSSIAALTIRRAKHLAAFVKLSPRSAVLAGVYTVGGHAALQAENFWAAPAMEELRSFGFTGLEQTAETLTLFEFAPEVSLSDWIGRLTIEWPKTGRLMVRRADNNSFPIRAIHEESAFSAVLPAWDRVVLNWAQLQTLPPSWRGALAQWRGVYYIFDTVRRAGYVGSASGLENLLGRWRGYAETGHGGNRGLRDSTPADLRFSILQLTSPDLPRDEIVGLENVWKTRLHTREFGLNAN